MFGRGNVESSLGSGVIILVAWAGSTWARAALDWPVDFRYSQAACEKPKMTMA